MNCSIKRLLQLEIYGMRLDSLSKVIFQVAIRQLTDSAFQANTSNYITAEKYALMLGCKRCCGGSRVLINLLISRWRDDAWRFMTRFLLSQTNLHLGTKSNLFLIGSI